MLKTIEEWKRYRREEKEIAQYRAEITRIDAAVDAEIAKAHASGNETEEHHLRADRWRQTSFERDCIQAIHDARLLRSAEKLHIFVPSDDYASLMTGRPQLGNEARTRVSLAVKEKRKKGRYAAALFIIAVIGTPAAILAVLPRHEHTTTLAEHVRCAEIGHTYMATLQGDSIDYLSMDHIDYSPSRRSCVVSYYRANQFGTAPHRETRAIDDALTKESLFSETCYQGDCGNGQNIEMMRRQEEAFSRLTR